MPTPTSTGSITGSSAGPRRTRLIFHIGDRKTGSTSIQLAFAQGLITLPGHSLFYPAKLASNPMGDLFTTYGKATNPAKREAAAEPLRKLANRIRKRGADFTVISAEAFEGVSPLHFRRVIDDIFADAADEIRVIGYVRPHAARLLSTYAERTKVGLPRALDNTMEDFVSLREDKQEFFYLPRFGDWRAQFGDAFTLRPMIRKELRNGSVVEDFLHVAFDGRPFTVVEDDPTNESLCLEDLMRLKVLQQRMQSASRDLRLKLGWEFARILSMLPPAPIRTKLRLHRSLAESIRTTYLEDARAMDRTFFDGVPLLETELQKAAAEAPEAPQSNNPADHLSPSEMRALDVYSILVMELLETEEVNWSAFLHRKRLEDVRAVQDARSD